MTKETATVIIDHEFSLLVIDFDYFKGYGKVLRSLYRDALELGLSRQQFSADVISGLSDEATNLSVTATPLEVDDFILDEDRELPTHTIYFFGTKSVQLLGVENGEVVTKVRFPNREFANSGKRDLRK